MVWLETHTLQKQNASSWQIGYQNYPAAAGVQLVCVIVISLCNDAV